MCTVFCIILHSTDLSFILYFCCLSYCFCGQMQRSFVWNDIFPMLCWNLIKESESESFSSSSTDVQIMGTRWNISDTHGINPLDFSADLSFSAPAARKNIGSLESLGTGTSFGWHLGWKTQTGMCVTRAREPAGKSVEDIIFTLVTRNSLHSAWKIVDMFPRSLPLGVGKHVGGGIKETGVRLVPSLKIESYRRIASWSQLCEIIVLGVKINIGERSRPQIKEQRCCLQMRTRRKRVLRVWFLFPLWKNHRIKPALKHKYHQRISAIFGSQKADSSVITDHQPCVRWVWARRFIAQRTVI